jgi:exodeoxyribonuclease VII small subunit
MAKKNYDTAVAELTNILDTLQNEEVKIEEVSKLVKKAKELTSYCKERLRQIEQYLDETLE